MNLVDVTFNLMNLIGDPPVYHSMTYTEDMFHKIIEDSIPAEEVFFNDWIKETGVRVEVRNYEIIFTAPDPRFTLVELRTR